MTERNLLINKERVLAELDAEINKIMGFIETAESDAEAELWVNVLMDYESHKATVLFFFKQ